MLSGQVHTYYPFYPLVLKLFSPSFLVRLFFLPIIFYLYLFPFSKTYADEGWLIESFSSKNVIQNDGKVQVNETLDINFLQLEKHGIYREIPILYHNTIQNEVVYVEDISVLRNNQNERFQTIDTGNTIQIKIGDPNRTISGKQHYNIKYSVKGALRSFDSHDEWYWNVTGNWDVPIQKAYAEIILPKEGFIQTTCYEGSQGTSLQTCTHTIPDSFHAVFHSSRPYQPGEGLTVVGGFTKGIVPIAIYTKKDLTSGLIEAFTSFPGILSMIIPFAIMVYVMGRKWYFQGRDLWSGIHNPFDKSAHTAPVPFAQKETIVVEFEPPENLRPAEIGVLMDQKADTLDVTATIIDLATRSYLHITEIEKKWIFGSTDYLLEKRQKSTEQLLSYEKELLDRLFDEGEQVKLSDLKTKFYKDLHKVKEKLYQTVTEKKLFSENPETIRNKYSIIAVLCFGIAIGIIAFIAIIPLYFVPFGLSMAVNGLLVLLLAQVMPRRTAKGYAVYLRAKGYEEFLSKAEKYRQQFFEKKNMFSEILPYTIVFGVTEKFAHAFKELGIQPSNPTWYSGSTFHVSTFGSHVNAFSTTFSHTITAAPKGSGFSSGGSSGGGFGGGGGGSW